MTLPPYACIGGLWATDLVEVSADPSCLDGAGRWAVVLPYAGEPVFLRFATWSPDRPDFLRDVSWHGPALGDWRSSMTEAEYRDAVERARDAIARGDVYQVNVCRVLEATGPLGEPAALFDVLVDKNPAPFAAVVSAEGMAVVTASPELFLARQHDRLASGPIKGTGRTEDDLLPKDSSENIMIVDLVRNDLSRICRTGSVEVPRLLDVEDHPGLVHLVSEVAGELIDGVGWSEILAATFPPGSVTGAPKSSALRLIDELEPAARQVYCGAVGWVDADCQEAQLAVAIRTFWIQGDVIRFGTGAGITWASDPEAEWDETELKAERLILLASSHEDGRA